MPYTRKIEQTIYTFADLKSGDFDEVKAKVFTHLYDLNVDYKWWDFIYDDADTIGAKISGFDTGRDNSINFELVDDIDDVISKILDNHGKNCDTYILAKEAKEVLDRIRKQYLYIECWDEYYRINTLKEQLGDYYEKFEGQVKQGLLSEGELSDLNHDYNFGPDYTEDEFLESTIDDFTQQLGECYIKMLRETYEYLTSEEAIMESLESNEYEFFEDGTIAVKE